MSTLRKNGTRVVISDHNTQVNEDHFKPGYNQVCLVTKSTATDTFVAKKW